MDVEKLHLPAWDDDVTALAALLVDAVESGAAVSFLAPLSLGDAEAWWRETLAALGPRGICLVARDDQGIAGSVQVHAAWAPNQPHRGEVVKLLVHTRARRQGIARQLMEAAEREARREGYLLLTLDAKTGGEAEQLYRALGWVEVGTIPRFALDPDRAAFHGATIFYRDL